MVMVAMLLFPVAVDLVSLFSSPTWIRDGQMLDAPGTEKHDGETAPEDIGRPTDLCGEDVVELVILAWAIASGLESDESLDYLREGKKTSKEEQRQRHLQECDSLIVAPGGSEFEGERAKGTCKDPMSPRLYISRSMSCEHEWHSDRPMHR